MPNDEQKEVKIRMHRQGLGDCFLLTFPRQPKPFYMLIDCGALNSKHYDADLMKQVVHDIQEATGGHLDAVVATHEHWDHISGFLQAKETFDEMNVQEVWVAWTEDRNSTAAKRIKAEFQKRKQAVELGLARFPDPMQGSQLGLYPPLWKQLQVKARGRVLLADAKDGSDIEQEVRVRLSPAECKSFQEATTYSDLYIEYRIAY